MKVRWLMISCLVVMLLMIALIPECRSDTVLFVQSLLLSDQDIFKSSGLKLVIPTGKTVPSSEWDESMKSFQPGQDFPHEDAVGRLSILYNFGDFKNGRSTFYNPDAACFNAHYGVYAVQLDEGIFGFKNGEPDLEAVTKLVAFDQLNLVMASLGCPKSERTFESELTDVEKNIDMAGFNDWIKIDARITTNSPLHQKNAFQQGYLQYGQPPRDYRGGNFLLIDMSGRLYLRYDADVNLTIIYFVIARNKNIVNETSRDYLIPIQWVKTEVKE
ncbi:hypothetical protein Q5O24_01580 [Eubacteriaceae bacterium ES3]|nr:hypothetical protein Q5O24_01580 [Eubacteriaceae bacterium ES3]